MKYLLNWKVILDWYGTERILRRVMGLQERTWNNNPHKLSLYIAAGLPVIVWQQAAIAEFVTTHKIGIVVESLKEISDKIQSLPESEYNEMTRAVNVLQKQVVSGSFTKRCLEVVEERVFNL